MYNTQELVQKGKNGDISSFMSLLREKEALIYNISFSYTKNSYDAEDCISEASIKAFDKLKQLKNEEKFYCWFISILINVCRKNIKSKITVSSDEAINQARDEFSYQSIDDRILVEELLSKLRKDERDIIALRYLKDYSIKEILADATGIEVIYNVSNPKYSINEISFYDKDGKEFTKDSGYIWGYTRPNLSSNDKEKDFCININDNVANYIKNNPVSIKINNLVVSDEKSENLIDKVSSLINNNSNLIVDWTLKMQIPMQQIKVIPVNKEYSLDIGTLKINSLKISILKSSFDYSFVPKDKNIRGVEPIFSIRLGNEYAMDQWLDGCNNEDGSTTGTQTFNSIYYKHLDQIGIKLIGIQANFRSPNLYKIDKNKLPMEFDCNGEKFKVTSANQKGDSNEYTIECNKTGRIYNELAFNFSGINSSRQTNKNENIQFKDQSSRDSIYSLLKQAVPNLKDIEDKFGGFQTGAVGATITTNSKTTEFRVSAVKNIICNEDEIVLHK